MDSFLVLFFTSLPFMLALGLAAMVAIFGGVVLGRPWLVLLPFLTALFWLTESRFGRLDAGGGPTLLTRGAGQLLFPAFLWALLISLAWLRIGAMAKPPGRITPAMPLGPWFAAWAVLLVGHTTVALVMGVPLHLALSPSGFSLLVWIWVLIATMLAAVAQPADARRLALFIMAMALARALFGLVRFAAFGGDPSNAYANNQGLTLKLTFFDTNDSLLCALGLAIALVMLYRAAPPQGWRVWQKACLWAAVVFPAVCIVLSFRRTAWIGTVLALVFVLLQLPRRVRWPLAGLALPVVLVGIAYAAWKRLSQVRGSTGGFFYDIVARQFGPESMRLLELQLAFKSFADHPLLGVGSWGGYAGWRQISWQYEYGEGGAGTFLHSGVLHLALKTGLVGMLLLAGTVVAFVLAWRRLRRTLPDAAMPLAVAGVAGVLFTLPDWLVGTPVSQVRTMMMLGLCLGLPFVAQRCFADGTAPAPARALARAASRRAAAVPARLAAR